MSKPRILLLITQADIGGAQIHVLDILRYLGERYHFVLATGFEDYLTLQARKLGVEVRVMKHLKRSINIKQDSLAFKECLALLREFKPDLLHTHSSKAGVIGRLAAWKLGVPSLFTAHGWAFTPGAPVLQRAYGLVLESLLCRLIGSVVTVSKFDFQLARRFHVGADKKRYLVRNGVGQSSSTPPRTQQSNLQIVTIGRLNLRTKNQTMLVEALALLDFPFHAKIIGAGASREALEAQISRLNLQHKIELLGEVEATDVHLVNADIFVLSSNYEGLPLSVLEAMSMGLPVVASDVGGVSEAVLHTQTGLLSPRGDIAGFAKNIKRLADNPQLRIEYGRAGYQHFEQHFTAQRMIDELLEVYKKVLNVSHG